MKRAFRILMCIIWSVLLAGLPPGCSDNPGGKTNATAENDWEGRVNGSSPNVVPYLDCVPSAVDGEGSAVLEPSSPVPVGSRGEFAITFTVGESGVVARGFVMLQVSPFWGWSQPQTLYPGQPGFTTVKTSFTDPSLKISTLRLNRILVYSMERAFVPGETITFNYGAGARVDRFAEAEELFQIFVDADGDGHSACIAHPPAIRTVARPALRLAVTVPSQFSPGEAIKVRAAALDPLGNWSECPAGAYSLKATKDGQVSAETAIELTEARRLVVFEHALADEGAFFFHVEGPAGLQGRSNVALCQKDAPRLKLYFGDIHGHSRMSDGSGTPEDYYRYARDVSGLDIASLTDHSDYGTIPIRGPIWKRIKNATNDAYEPGRFVTFLGFEWTNWEYGHRNVYYRDGDGPVFRSIDPESNRPEELWNLLAPYEAMTIAHHVGGGPVATNWDVPPGSKEWLVEICSVHGSSEYRGGEALIYRPVVGSFVRDALSRGYRLGIIASGDTHDGHPGQRSVGAIVNGIVGVYSPELTREAIWEAFRRRHVYGTSGPRIILNFRVADSPMGSQVRRAASDGPVPLALRAVTCDEIETIEIIRNGEPVFVEKGDGIFAQLLLEDPQPLSGTSWYYVRILQKDGNMAWSSPVWVTIE